MICIVQMDKGSENIIPQPTGWIIATDIREAERKASLIGHQKLAKWLSVHRGLMPGKYFPDISNDSGQMFILCSADNF